MMADESDKRPHELLSRALPAIRRRLALESRIDRVDLALGALPLALEQLTVPAALVDNLGRVVLANEVAAHWKRWSQSEFQRLQRDPAKNETIVRINALGAPPWFLVISGKRSRADTELAEASRQWQWSPREQEVARWVLAGKSNGWIAKHLDLSPRTVEAHVGRLTNKAMVRSRSALFAAVHRTRSQPTHAGR